MAVIPGVPDVTDRPATQGFVLPSQVSGIASDNLFNPASANSFYNNFNDASVNYSADQTQEGQRLNDLIAAYTYLQDPTNQTALDQENYAGFSQYMLQQLQADVTEQNNLVQYGTAQTNYTTAQGTASWLSGIWGNISQGNNEDAGSWGGLTQALQASNINPTVQFTYNGSNFNSDVLSLESFFVNNNDTGGLLALGKAMGASSAVTNQINSAINFAANNAQTAMNTAGATAVNGAVVNSPDYNQEQNAVTTYYQGNDATGGGINDPNSAVYQAIQPAIETGANSIYDQVYNIKNDINTQAAQTGVMNSGERQAALSNTQGAGQQAAQAVAQSAMDQAKSAEAAEAQSIQSQQATQTNLQNDLTGGTLENLFSTATGNSVNAYNAQTGAQDTENIANNEQSINTAQNSLNLQNAIFGQAGNAIGTAAGNYVSGVLI